jgi:hypothetical protein
MRDLRGAHAGHEVLNQARPATGWNAFEDDRLLVSPELRDIMGRAAVIRGSALPVTS